MIMHKSSQLPGQAPQKEITVGANECRLARQGERLIARGILSDVVVTIQVPIAGFAAMLRFSAPEEKVVSQERLEILWEFADQALALLFESIRSMEIPAKEIIVSAMGGADVAGRTHGRGKQLAMAIKRSLWRHGIVLKGNDLGGSLARGIWLETTSGRLIVRSSIPTFADTLDAKSASENQKHKAS